MMQVGIVMKRSQLFQRRLASTRRTLLRNAGRATLAAGAIASLGRVSVASAQEDDGAGLIGSWGVTNGTAGSQPNAVLVNFIPGGIFMRAGTTHPTESPGFGAWRQVDDSRFEVTYMVVQFDKTGTFIGHRKAWLDVTVNPSGMSWTARTRGATIDPSGNETPTAPGANGGKRIVAEPFETG
jgi:hypothetical protein